MKIITLLLLFGHAHDFEYHLRASLIVIVFNTLWLSHLSHQPFTDEFRLNLIYDCLQTI